MSVTHMHISFRLITSQGKGMKGGSEDEGDKKKGAAAVIVAAAAAAAKEGGKKGKPQTQQEENIGKEDTTARFVAECEMPTDRGSFRMRSYR